MSKWVPKVILEGTRLTHKTETAFALNEHPRLVGNRMYRYHSPVVSGEWCGFTNQPWGRGLINYLPEEEGMAQQTYRTWLDLMEQLRYYSWIIDRFHISTQAYQLHEYGRVFDCTEIEERLIRLNFRQVLLTRQPSSFEDARRERLKISGNPKQYNDLSPFLAEQERLRALVQSSKITSIEIDITELSPESIADKIADWVVESGGQTLIEPSHPLLSKA